MATAQLVEEDMALAKCNECGAEVLPGAKNCPQCGKEREVVSGGNILIALVVIFSAMLIGVAAVAGRLNQIQM